MSDLVSKFERILRSEYCRIEPREIVPDIKSIPNQASAYQPEVPSAARSSGLSHHGQNSQGGLTISGQAAPFQTELPPVRSGGLNGHYNIGQQYQGTTGSTNQQSQMQNGGPLLHHLMGQQRLTQVMLLVYLTFPLKTVQTQKLLAFSLLPK